MIVTFYGTRGSVAICRESSVRHGGNTTCLRMESDALGLDHWLVIDGGTGFFQAGIDAMKAGVKKLTMLFTHWHHDHTGGLLLAPQLYSPELPMEIFGPWYNGFGGKRVKIARPALTKRSQRSLWACKATRSSH